MSREPATIRLRRPCPVVLVPSGRNTVLPEGSEVALVQTLGGSFTIQSLHVGLARVAAEDADALGLEGQVAASAPSGAGGEVPAEVAPFSIEQVYEELRSVYDPEIPINVVDLGLVYECDAHRLDDGTYRVEIKMSMTAPGCGMGDILKEDAQLRVATVAGVSEVDVELVWDPPWDLSRLSESARLQLGVW